MSVEYSRANGCVINMAKKSYKRSGRKPRTRRASGTNKSTGDSLLRLKIRIARLEAHMSTTESFLGIHEDQKPLQDQIDSVEEE